MAPRLCRGVGALALLLLLGQAAGRRPEKPDAEEGIRILEADEPRRWERIRIGGPPVRYRPVGLHWGIGYEARVSFPGTNPVRVQLWLEPPSGDVEGSSSGSSSGGLRRQLWGGSGNRKLLDAEKIMFHTDNEGRFQLGGQTYASVDVLLSAERWGMWWQPWWAPKLLVYDIVLEQSTLGVPHSALPLLGTGLMLVVFVSAAMPWWSAKAVPALLLWLNGSQRAVAAVRARVGGGGAKRRSPAKATSRSPLQRPPR